MAFDQLVSSLEVVLEVNCLGRTASLKINCRTTIDELPNNGDESGSNEQMPEEDHKCVSNQSVIVAILVLAPYSFCSLKEGACKHLAMTLCSN